MFIPRKGLFPISWASCLVVATGLLLSGCAWASGAGLGVVVVLVLTAAVGCGAHVIVEGDEGSADSPPDAPPDDPPKPDPTECGGGYCPVPMHCETLDDGEP